MSAGGLVSRILVSAITVQSRTAKGIGMLNLQVLLDGSTCVAATCDFSCESVWENAVCSCIALLCCSGWR